MNTQSLNDGPNAVTVGSSFAPQQQEDASSWGTRALPKLAFLAEMTVEAEVQAEREEAALAARRAEELSDDVIVIDDASPTNLSDAEKESNDEEVQDHDESSDDDEFGEEYERKVEVVIARLARYGPSIFVQKTVQKHQTMAALVSITYV